MSWPLPVSNLITTERNSYCRTQTQRVTEPEEPTEEADLEPNPDQLLINSMTEPLKWTRQIKLLCMEKNKPDLIEDADSLEKTTKKYDK